MIKHLLLAGTAYLSCSLAAHAQSAFPNSIQVSAIYNALSGSDYKDYSGGAGIELQYRRTAGTWSFGGGLQATSHSLDNSRGIGGSAKLVGLFFEPRYVIPNTSSTAPYLSARLAVIRQSLTTDEIVQGQGKFSGSATGVQGNVGGGVLIALSRRVNLDLGATFGLVRFGNFTADQSNVSVETQKGSGTNVVVRAGLGIGLGANR